MGNTGEEIRLEDDALRGTAEHTAGQGVDARELGGAADLIRELGGKLGSVSTACARTGEAFEDNPALCY